jgi:hypothetical protein
MFIDSVVQRVFFSSESLGNRRPFLGVGPALNLNALFSSISYADGIISGCARRS